MLRVNDKVYLHLKDLDVSVNKLGFNIDRLCIVKDISIAKDSNGEDVGMYVLKSVHSDKEYKIMSNDRMWRMSEADKLIEVIKASPSLDERTKEEILEKIYG